MTSSTGAEAAERGKADRNAAAITRGSGGCGGASSNSSATRSARPAARDNSPITRPAALQQVGEPGERQPSGRSARAPCAAA